MMQPFGRPMTLRERATQVVHHWLREACAGALDVCRDPATTVYTAHPESLGEYRTYVRSRAWVPEGHEGALLVWLGITYHCILGLPCKLFGYGVAWTGSRPLRLGIALVLTVGSLLGLVASGLL